MQRTLSRIIITIFVLGLIGYGANPFLVQAASPLISVNPTSGVPGSSTTVTGSSFSANETPIAISWDGAMVTSGISANATGGWNATFVIPASRSGSHTIGASGPASSANTTFTVTPGISTEPVGGTPGRSITVIGAGFGAVETGIAVTYDGTVVASSITANSQGGWSATFVLPASRSGPHTIDAYGSSTLATAVSDITFTITPSISVNRTSAVPGSSIIVTGAGFGTSETGITVTYDGTAVASSIIANATGGWSATFVVPASPPGSHIIDAYGSSSSAATISDITFTATPGISINPLSVAPGNTVTVIGAGFGAGETGIMVTYDGTVVASSIIANSQGGWSATFVVPASVSGSHAIDAYGSSTSTTTIPDITFTITPGISINPTSGAPGSSIIVTGAGFGAGETGITVTYDDKAVSPGISANSRGGWSATFVIPASASGSHTIDAYSQSTLVSTVPDITFTITPGISINPASGAAGSSITVTGAGFGAGETGITVTYDDKAVAPGISANSQGGWRATFVVPASAFGSHRIGAYGSITQTTSVSEAGFNIGPGILLSPASGYVGATVAIIGSGFAANSPLGFTYDGKEIPADGITTDASGSFSKSITIPKSPAGSHTIKVVDGQNNDSKATFTMESTPPLVPTLLSPRDGARLGILGDITPTLKWSNMTDPSGVTFILQVDTSPDFSQLILEKKAISGSHYTLAVAEALPRGDYYWRVKAVNGASVESAWSQTRMLSSGLMPLWTLVTILVFMVAIVAGGVYFFMVRRLRRRWEGIPVPEAETPQVVPGQWRLIEPREATSEHPLPWRLALPQPAKGEKVLSTEEMARLKVIVDFAQSLPLVEPGYSANWLLDLMQTSMGIEASTTVYQQLLGDELQVRYEPAWMRHPIYQDLSVLLEGQPILQELNAFVDAVNRCASEAILLLQEVYHEAIAETPSDFLERGGWGFISAVYSDAVSWFLGKSLREPSERDYSIKPGGGTGEEPGGFCLWGGETTSFAGSLIEAPDEEEVLQVRALHLRLRRVYRNSDRARQLVDIMTQLEVQRAKLVSAFSQFGRFMP